jgi:hypothetical protein
MLSKLIVQAMVGIRRQGEPIRAGCMNLGF